MSMEDVLLDIETADLQTSGGDLVTGYADEQHQAHLLVFQKGALKEAPEVGVGLESYLMGDDVDGMLREVRFQFEKDGMTVDAVVFDNLLNDLSYDAKY